ncbi:MAG: ACR3 family arsenite efflux transporter [Mycoplasmatales bacterium]
MKQNKISFFERNLTIWVLVCMVLGILISNFLPIIPETLTKFEYYNVSIPIALLIWIMIFPMMLKVDFTSVKRIKEEPRGLYLTWIINWLVKPFTMFAITWFFFFVVFKAFIPPELAKDYLAGAILLGAAPCTAMVFVWSKLTNGNPLYTVIQVATNDLLILVLFVPIVGFLLGMGNIIIPYQTLFLSVILFVVIPLVAGIVTRNYVLKRYGEEYFTNKFIKMFDKYTIVGLLLTLVLIFSFQGNVIISNPFNIALIAIPLVIQSVAIFGLTYFIAYKLRLNHEIAAPAAMIGGSNFFELSVAVAITIFGVDSPVVLTTIVGVLVEVPIMLMLCNFANKTAKAFK